MQTMMSNHKTEIKTMMNNQNTEIKTILSNQKKQIMELSTALSNQKTDIKNLMNNQNTEIKTIKNQMIKIISMLEKAACSVRAAGIENSAIIEDHQLTSSSQYPSSNCEPRDGRLHSTTGDGWLMNRPYRVGEWLQVDLESNRRIFGVATQGQRVNSNYVTTYVITFK